MTTVYPADLCQPPAHIPPPTAKTVRECQLENLLRETLPYLQAVESSPSTSVVLRALIIDIHNMTEGN